MNIQALLAREGVTVVDVREAYEFRSGHVEGSVNIPLSELGRSLDRYRQLSQPLILVCRTGNRSGMVAEFLRRQGLKEVYNGGAWDDVAEWKRAA